MSRPLRQFPALVVAAVFAVACTPGAPPSSAAAPGPRAPQPPHTVAAPPGRTIVVDGLTLTLLPSPPPSADTLATGDGSSSPPDPAAVDAVDLVPVVAGGGEHPSLAPAPPSPPIAEGPSRARRRMDLDQLDAAFLAATGGLTWTENGVNQWQTLAPTLGRPDFLTSTEEDLTPSLLFQKFLGDAARKTCSDLFARETSTPAAQRVFFVGLNPDERSTVLGPRLDANLQRLLLRFHGRDTREPGTEGALDGWRWLWLSVEHLESPRSAWMATCVALIEHPDFYMY